MKLTSRITARTPEVGKRSSAPNLASRGLEDFAETDMRKARELHPSSMPRPNQFTMRPMSIFGFARTAALIPGILVFAPGVAAQAAPSDPARFVASIYANGREATVWAQWLAR